MDSQNRELETQLQVVGHNVLSVNKNAVEELKSQRDLLARFVKSQLKEADFSARAKDTKAYGEGDFGVIPGTPKPCLLKPGAEKLLRLFGLGVRFRQTDKEFDRQGNFASFTYRAEVFSVNSGHVVAECEATANSQEKKYREIKVWDKKVKGSFTMEPTPICDILNTLQKMAQKRAMVGATILATGASEYFTQDVLDNPDFLDAEVLSNVTVAKKPQPPRETGAKSENVSGEEANLGSTPPICCDKPMFISKYEDKKMGHKPWFCMTCSRKVAAT